MISAGVYELPGIVGIDHVSTTVPDLDEAVDFFVGALGAVELYRRDHRPTDADEMPRRFNAHPSASYRLAKLDLCGMLLEVFEYNAPDLAPMARNCDAGGHHIGFRVADIDAAVGVLRAIPDVRVLGQPSMTVMANGTTRRWVYFLTPWGLQLELAEERPA